MQVLMDASSAGTRTMVLMIGSRSNHRSEREDSAVEVKRGLTTMIQLKEEPRFGRDRCLVDTLC